MNPQLKSVVVALVLAVAFSVPTLAHAADKKIPREALSVAFREAIPNAPGMTMTAMVVDYPPGGKSRSHRHGLAFVVGYVLSGEIRSQVDDGKARVYKAGEHWTEKPGAHHKVSENASATKPAKLLAIFVADSKVKAKGLVSWDR